jgi:hypothetical protein
VILHIGEMPVILFITRLISNISYWFIPFKLSD